MVPLAYALQMKRVGAATVEDIISQPPGLPGVDLEAVAAAALRRAEAALDADKVPFLRLGDADSHPSHMLITC